MISIESVTTPQSVNSLSCAGEFFVVLAFKFSVLRQILIIICATRAGVKLGVLAFKIRVLRQKCVIICATRAGAYLFVLAIKIRVLRQKSSHYVCHSCGSKYTRFIV